MDIGKWVIVHRLLKVDGVENLDGVAMLQKGVAALNHDAAFGIGDYIGTVHLHEGGFDEKTVLAAATAADDQDVLFRAYLGFFGRLDMVSFSVWVRGMFQSGIGST